MGFNSGFKGLNKEIILRCKFTKSIENKKVKIIFIALTLLTETCVNVEKYSGHSEVVVGLMAEVCKCQTDTDSTGSNG